MKRLFTLILIVTTVSCVCFAQSADDEKYEQAKKYYNAKENSKVIPILNELAQRNHAKALNLLGFCYEYGYGVAKNLKKSVECFQKSANLGLVDAQINLGYMYVKGLGEPKTIKKHIICIRRQHQKVTLMLLIILGLYMRRDWGLKKI